MPRSGLTISSSPVRSSELKPLVAFHVTVPSATENVATLAVSERMTRRTIATTPRRATALSLGVPALTWPPLLLSLWMAVDGPG